MAPFDNEKIAVMSNDRAVSSSPSIAQVRAESRSTVVTEIRNANPPMVGVPDLDRCQDGPSEYMG